MTVEHKGLGLTEYARRCALLGQAPDLRLRPAARSASLPKWLGPELIASEPARQKLADWATATPREQWDTPPEPAGLITGLHFVGDQALLLVVAGVLSLLPAPVRDYTRRRATFIGAGVVALGWAGARPDFGDRPFVVALSAADGTPEQMRDLAAHEIAHVWLCQEPAPGMTDATAFAYETVQHTPLHAVPVSAITAVIEERRRLAREEQIAIALTRAWGYRDL